MALVGDDCFFFLNSGCVRGSQCTFRHQPAARSTTVVCPQWLQRCCYKPNCVFRHTDDIVGRNQTPCYYEASTGVCWKPRCAFAHVKKPHIPVPLPPPPAVLPLRPPVLPAMPPVLPVIPPMLPASIGITNIPPPAPLPTNLPLPNSTHVVRPVRPDIPVIQKTVAVVATRNTTTVPPVAPQQAVVPPPGLPSPSKLTEMLLGTKLPPAVKGVGSPADQKTPPTTTASNQTGPAAVAAPASVAPKPAVAVHTAFPKSDHFNEQVRRFKEMLATKSMQGQVPKKHKNGCSDDEKSGGYNKVKERQRNKKERREKEGHKSHKSSRASKEKLSKADEEILYGDYKDVPLDKKHKKKKHKEHREYADSDPEIKVKSYEQILREKALRKLYSRRKEKFNEDFKELVDDHVIRIDDTPDKNDRVNDGLPDKVLRKNKRYNSDGDEVESSDDSQSQSEEENYKRRHSNKKEDSEKMEMKKHEEKHNHIRDTLNNEYHTKINDIQDELLRRAIVESEKRHRKHSKKRSKKRRHKEKRAEKDEEKEEEDEEEEEETTNFIEVRSNSVSPKEVIAKAETSSDEESDDSSDETEDTDSDSDTADVSEGKKEQIIIPDETTNIDFSVDLDDELAMEINQTEQSESSSKSKKLMSSIVVPINLVTPDIKNKYHKKSQKSERGVSARHHKSSDSKSSDRGHNKVTDPKKSNERDQRRRSPKDSKSNSNKPEKIENKKVVRLVNTTEQPIVQGGRTSPILSTPVVKEAVTDNKSIPKKDIKVKSFEEIMAEKQKRNKVHLIVSPDVVDVSESPILPKNINATLKEKSTRAKLEILDVPKEQNGASVAEDTTPSKSKHLTEEERHKRKSIPLYKPPQPVKVDNGVQTVAKTMEIKMVVNTGPRKIIRIRKASLSTDLIDQAAAGEGTIVNETAVTNEKNDNRETVKVRSFEEIIKEKRARQKRERELTKQMEKENAASNETSSASATNNLIRRKPVIRRQPTCNAIYSSTPSISKTFSTSNSIPNSVTTTMNNSYTDTHVHHNTANETKRTVHSDSNVAKVSPLNIVPAKRRRSDSSGAPVVSQSESLENKDFFSRLRNTASRRSAVASSHSAKDSEKTPPSIKSRKKSISSTEASSIISSNHVPNENIKSNVHSALTDCSNETKSEYYHGSSRKDIQEALDEERRKREQDLLSDDEFEKEINELGSDDGDDNFDDINEDDLMMELEQMIDS